MAHRTVEVLQEGAEEPGHNQVMEGVVGEEGAEVSPLILEQEPGVWVHMVKKATLDTQRQV